MNSRKLPRALVFGASLGALAGMHGGAHALAAEEASAAKFEEIVITGARIAREGYLAPTPLPVVSTEAMQAKATSNVAQFLNTMPVFAGSSQP